MPTAQEWSRINAWLADIRQRSKRMYIGRTNFPERRLLQHRRDKGLNKLFALHWAENAAAIVKVEEELIERHAHLERLENAAIDSRGGWGDGPHGVYIAWVWMKNFGMHEVLGLTPVELAALPSSPRRSRYLYCPLSPQQAALALNHR